jgi:hypothetical protein
MVIITARNVLIDRVSLFFTNARGKAASGSARRNEFSLRPEQCHVTAPDADFGIIGRMPMPRFRACKLAKFIASAASLVELRCRSLDLRRWT